MNDTKKDWFDFTKDNVITCMNGTPSWLMYRDIVVTAHDGDLHEIQTISGPP